LFQNFLYWEPRYVLLVFYCVPYICCRTISCFMDRFNECWMKWTLMKYETVFLYTATTIKFTDVYYVTQCSVIKIYQLLWNQLHRHSGVPICSMATTRSSKNSTRPQTQHPRRYSNCRLYCIIRFHSYTYNRISIWKCIWKGTIGRRDDYFVFKITSLAEILVKRSQTFRWSVTTEHYSKTVLYVLL
jgi:hypothetical protein